VARQRGQAGAEDEQEQHRLDQAGDGPQPVAFEPDQLAVPDNADRAQVLAQPALGHRDPDRRREWVDLGRGELSGHRCYLPLRIAMTMARFLSPAVASESLIVRPV
jgi:hypothetical protein